MVDVFRDKDESRENYLGRYLQLIHSGWTGLGNGEKELVSEHIRSFDHPAEYGDFISWSGKAGFEVYQAQTEDGLHRMLVLKKS